MAEDWAKLDGQIDDLVSKVRHGTGIFGSLDARSLERPFGQILPILVYDWRPAWDLAKSIQAQFSAKIRYPTREEREAAWVKFNDARNDLRQRSNADRETVFEISQAWRDFLYDLIGAERYSKINDILFFFDPTTVEDMKASGERLRDCGRRLSNAKGFMLKEHKDECFQYIQEIRATHDLFWDDLKGARAQRQAEISARIDDTLARIEGNIEKNREKLSNAEDALSRCEANIDKLRDIIAGAYSDNFRTRHEEFLDQAYEKKSSIEESIRRLAEWISQDEERLDDIYRKRR